MRQQQFADDTQSDARACTGAGTGSGTRACASAHSCTSAHAAASATDALDADAVTVEGAIEQGSVGTVTLTAPATSGGIRIDLSTSASDIAAPTVGSITIPEGSTTGTFNIDVHTISSSQDVQITARYGNIAALNAILRVTIFPPVARFTVTGAQRREQVHADRQQRRQRL